VILMIWPVLVLAAEPEVTASWTAPTEGSAVHHYTFRLFEDGVVLATYFDVIGTSLVIPEGVISSGRSYTADVAGTDDSDRQGPWSPLSPPFIWDAGPPGACSAVAWEVSQQ